MTEKLSVYIAASSAEIDRAAKWGDFARTAGFEVTSNWVENIRKVTAERAGGNLNEGANPRFVSVAERRGWANENLDNIERAAVFWLLVPSAATPSQGAYYEFGYATKAGKYTIASGGEQRFVFTAKAWNLADTDEHGFAYLTRRLIRADEARSIGWSGVDGMTPPWETAK